MNQHVAPFILTFAAMLGFLVTAAPALESQAEGNSMTATDGERPGAVLIVYLSRTGNTKVVAELIHHEVRGDLVALELRTPYAKDYDAIVAQVSRENETGYLPPLATKVDNLEQYETVFLGFPTWDMQLPPPMKSFLQQHDLSGKTVVPFNTNAGYGVGSGFDDVQDLCPDANVLEGLSLRGGYEREGIHLAIRGARKEEVRDMVIEWLHSIDMLDTRGRVSARKR